MSISLVINLIIAAFLSGLLYVILKSFKQFNVFNLHGITANYITAGLFSFFSNYAHNSAEINNSSSYIVFALSLGLLFIFVFYTAALTTQKAGVAITSIAGKMSMVIPVVAGIVLYGDKINAIRIVGIVIAILSVYLSSKRDDNNISNISKSIYIYPALLFFGSGFVDLMIKVSQHYFITPNNEQLFFAYLFCSAGTFGCIATAFLYFKKRVKIEIKSIVWGMILGITNYYSLVFLVKCLSTQGAESAIVFSISNILVVFFSIIFAILIFKEKPSKTNYIGLTLALLAIILLSN